MQFMVKEVRYAQCADPFGEHLRPYAHQAQTLRYIRQAIEHGETICIENTSVTGSGKTLANFAVTILGGFVCWGVYQTNDLVQVLVFFLHPYLRRRLVFLDSQGLEEIMAEHAHMHPHAHALSWASGTQYSEEPTSDLQAPD